MKVGWAFTCRQRGGGVDVEVLVVVDSRGLSGDRARCMTDRGSGLFKEAGASSRWGEPGVFKGPAYARRHEARRKWEERGKEKRSGRWCVCVCVTDSRFRGQEEKDWTSCRWWWRWRFGVKVEVRGMDGVLRVVWVRSAWSARVVSLGVLDGGYLYQAVVCLSSLQLPRTGVTIKARRVREGIRTACVGEDGCADRRLVRWMDVDCPFVILRCLLAAQVGGKAWRNEAGQLRDRPQ